MYQVYYMGDWLKDCQQINAAFRIGCSSTDLSDSLASAAHPPPTRSGTRLHVVVEELQHPLPGGKEFVTAGGKNFVPAM